MKFVVDFSCFEVLYCIIEYFVSTVEVQNPIGNANMICINAFVIDMATINTSCRVRKAMMSDFLL